MEATRPIIEMRGVGKRFGKFEALKDIDLEVAWRCGGCLSSSSALPFAGIGQLGEMMISF